MSDLTATIAGRSIKVKAPNETQLLLMNRDAKRAQRAAKTGEYENGVSALVNVLEVVEYLIIDEDDRDFIAQLMIKGDLEAPDLLTAIFEGVQESVEPEPQKKVAVNKATKRAAAKA